MNRIALFVRSRNRKHMEEQLQRCRRLAETRGLPWETAAVFKEHGSGTEPEDCRPAYHELLTAIRAGRCDLVLVDELSRLTRDMEEFAELWRLVRRGALRLITVDGVDTGWAEQRAE
jgi:DNA invertase Pin-like site-specific DNA recombinase